MISLVSTCNQLKDEMNSIGLVCCYVTKQFENALICMGEVKLTYLLQKCFDPLNISYSGCHGNSEGACKIWLNSIQ